MRTLFHIAASAMAAGILAGCAGSPPGTRPNPHPLAAAGSAPAEAAMPVPGSEQDGLATASRPPPLRLSPMVLSPLTGPAPSPIPPRAPTPPTMDGEGRAAIVPVLPGTQVSLAFDVRAVDVRPSHAAQLGQTRQDLPAEGEVIERGVVTVPLDGHGRGAGIWSHRQPMAYLARIDPPSGRYHPMVEDLGLRMVVAVQPSPKPGQRWIRAVVILDDVADLNEDPQAGTARPTLRTEQWQVDLDLRDGVPVRYPFFVRDSYRTEIRLESATIQARGTTTVIR